MPERLMNLKNKGFTIVETMIVLAIAGLILLIIFEAIPSVETSSRNNQRRQDVQTALEAVSHWELNNSGNIPCTVLSPTCPTVDPYLTGYKDKLTYYQADHINIYVFATSPGISPAVNEAPNTNTEIVNIYNYQKCISNSQGSTDQGAGYNDVVALYSLEQRGASVGIPQCEQL
jgi:prepilin-type N-terminal cleavage/methylation domain-containing protein